MTPWSLRKRPNAGDYFSRQRLHFRKRPSIFAATKMWIKQEQNHLEGAVQAPGGLSAKFVLTDVF